MDEESVKKRILGFRMERKLSQKEMADKLGISRNAYRAIENGQTRMLSAYLDAIAQIANTSTEELVLGYKPADIQSLNDIKAAYESRINNEREEYLRQIEQLRLELKRKDETIALQRETINSQNATIGYLQKQTEND